MLRTATASANGYRHACDRRGHHDKGSDDPQRGSVQKESGTNRQLNGNKDPPMTPVDVGEKSQVDDLTTRRGFIHTSAAVAASPVLIATASEPVVAERSAVTIQTDVLVCGCGCAGSAATLSAARRGAKVHLVDKAPFAGVIITSVGLPYFDGIASIRDRRIVVRGIALELLSKSGVCGEMRRPWESTIRPSRTRSSSSSCSTSTSGNGRTT